MILPLLLLLAAPTSAQAPGGAAGSVVRSKEWIVRRGKNPEEEFVGDVRYEAGGTRLSADWALYRHVQKDWKARGRVVLRRALQAGDVVEARGETARFDEDTRRGELLPASGGRVDFTRLPADRGEPDRGEGDRLEWTGDKTATLVGRARVWGPRLELWADSARYERDARTLYLRGGRPVVRKVDEEGGWTTALKADEVEATDSPRRLEARGKVKGWLVFKDEAKLKELAK
jgi:lipopolysaccharide assembly outer membrane protein LptD (OstA)